jgi:aspartyl-tRNA(Asn)/glutamyl-tRNA(Gln) amidotransferase subunit A
MTTRDLPDETIASLAERLRRKELSPVELATAVLERIEHLDPFLNAYITLVADGALQDAQRAEAEIMAGSYRGPLHGIPIGHKDILRTRGVRTTAHSNVLIDHVPDEDAAVVASLRRAGAVTMGKLSTHEFACGSTPVFGLPINPWSSSHVTGGSSAGSASAVRAGLCVAATGSDTAGSIRVPAAFCGVVGLKPTLGLVSTSGAIAVSATLDHVGPLTRSVADAALMLAAMVGDGLGADGAQADAVDALAARWGPPASLRGVRLGVPTGFLDPPVQPTVAARAREALTVFEGLGAHVFDVPLPRAAHSLAALRAIMWPEATLNHLHWLRTRLRAYGPDARRTVAIGAAVTGVEYLQGRRLRDRIRAEFESAWANVDALVWPTAGRTAFAVGEPQDFAGHQTRLTNLTGTPSLSVPCGFDDAGLPVAIQINGPAHAEATLFRLGAAFEAATTHHERRPCVARVTPPPPPEGRFAAPEVLASLGARERERLEADVERALRRLDVDLVEDDLPTLVGWLAALRQTMAVAGPG